MRAHRLLGVRLFPLGLPVSGRALGHQTGEGDARWRQQPTPARASVRWPDLAGKPPPGLHLDVVKGDKLIEKLIIDEKYYLFGRNPDLSDFIDHQSHSGVHAAHEEDFLGRSQ